MYDFCLNVDRGTYAEQVARNLGKYENPKLLFRALCGIHSNKTDTRIAAQHTATTFRTWQINNTIRINYKVGRNRLSAKKSDFF